MRNDLPSRWADPARAVSRRGFLAASGGLVLATTALGRAAVAAGTSNKELSPLVLSSDLYSSPTPQRFVFAVAVGPDFASRGPAQVGFVPPSAPKGSKQTITLEPTTLHKRGLPKGRGVYVADLVFDEPGVWNGIVSTRGKQVPFAVEVQAQPVSPIVGSAASRAPSPTKADPLGVKPICTRQPPCPLHTASLSEVIGAGAPVAVMFATPALCQSQYCGPVLDELLEVRDRYPGVTFVHVEIYASNRGADLSPTVEAWGIQTEPWLYTVDPAGTIVGRIDGAFGRDEIVQQLDALVAPT
jgi:hypothetical protein